MAIETTKVIFLIHEDANEQDLFAFFPEIKEGEDEYLSYSSEGQHSECSLEYALESREADRKEYIELQKELKNAGYELQLVHKNYIEDMTVNGNTLDESENFYNNNDDEVEQNYTVGDKVIIDSDNEGYDEYKNMPLTVIKVSTNRNELPGFDESINEALYNLEDENGHEIPFSLYDYELDDYTDNELNEVQEVSMNNLDWGETTQERNDNVEKYNSLKTKQERLGFLLQLKGLKEAAENIEDNYIIQYKLQTFDLRDMQLNEVIEEKETIESTSPLSAAKEFVNANFSKEVANEFKVLQGKYIAYYQSGPNYKQLATKEDRIDYDEGEGQLFNVRVEISVFKPTKSSLNEIHSNDEILQKLRAKNSIVKPIMKQFDKQNKNSNKIKALEKEKKQLMFDMEQEAEPQGGKIADEYGDKLDAIERKIAKLKNLKEVNEYGSQEHYLEEFLTSDISMYDSQDLEFFSAETGKSIEDLLALYADFHTINEAIKKIEKVTGKKVILKEEAEFQPYRTVDHALKTRSFGKFVNKDGEHAQVSQGYNGNKRYFQVIFMQPDKDTASRPALTTTSERKVLNLLNGEQFVAE